MHLHIFAHHRQPGSGKPLAIGRPLTFLTLYCMVLALAAPLSSVYTEYVYNYQADVAFGATGIRFTAKAHLELLYATDSELSSSEANGQLVRLRLSDPVFYAAANVADQQEPQPLMIDRKQSSLYNPEHDLYAHIVTLANGTAYIKALYTHQAEAATFKNIKKSILLNLLPTNHHNARPILHHSHKLFGSQPPLFTDDNNNAQPELFSPDSISEVNIFAKLKSSPSSTQSALDTSTNSNSLGATAVLSVYQTIEGYQNVTFRSRVFSQAQSNITTKFQLDLVNEVKSSAHERFDQADSMANAIQLLDTDNYQADTVELQRERRVCSSHHCDKSIAKLFQDYRESLTDDSIASVEASVAFLRLVDRLRESQGTSATEILSLLKKNKGRQDIQSSLLDILAAARTKDSIQAALKHLKLATNGNLDVAERFLSVLSVVAKTTSKMNLRRPLMSAHYFTPTPALKRSRSAREQLAPQASLEFIAKQFLDILERTPARKWASHKLRWSTLLTLATLVNTNSQELDEREPSSDKLSGRVTQLLFNELKACDTEDTDCRIVVLQAIGNVGTFGDQQFLVLKDYVLNSGKRESISAMRVLRDLLQNKPKDKPLSNEFYTSLKDLLLRVAYDNSHETTARVLAAEMIARFVPSSLASEELLHHLPSFGNNELATMIYSRVQSLRPNSSAKHHENWYWKSCIINGTSASFVRTMAKTDSLTASYGVNVELNKDKLLRESSFDVFLDTKRRTQDLFSLGIFARGLSKLPGINDDPDDDSPDAMAGMTLRLLGGYLRPIVFFSGAGELITHAMVDTAKDFLTVFNGDLLLIDHEEGYPLISGFVAEQQMRGVLSIDVSGRGSVSLWHRNSHSVVRTKAAILVQASQSLFTSYDNLWHSHLFSFGGQALIDFVADVDFRSKPKICLQVTQPEFTVRYNSRRHDQLMTDDIRRKIVRRNFSIGAKSYSLNTENNKMCAAMSDEL